MTQNENKPEIIRTLNVINESEALRLRMKPDSWNIFMFVEHEGEAYVFDFEPSQVNSIDEDVTIIHNEWQMRVREHHGESSEEEEEE